MASLMRLGRDWELGVDFERNERHGREGDLSATLIGFSLTMSSTVPWTALRLDNSPGRRPMASYRATRFSSSSVSGVFWGERTMGPTAR